MAASSQEPRRRQGGTKSGRPFTWIPRPDGAQLTLLALCVFDLTFFCYYLFNYELDRQHTISDTLFGDGGYRAVLTCLLAARLLGVVLFLYRFRFKHTVWEIVGYIGVFLAFFGWCWLVRHRENTQHFIGVGIFCVGSFWYSLALVRLAATSEDDKELLHACMDGFLLLCVVVLVISFVALWVQEEQDGWHSVTDKNTNEPKQSAYIVEHAAYIVQVVFYAFFFLYHSPNPWKVTDGSYSIGTEEYEPGAVPMVCRPLIPDDRRVVLTVVSEED